MAIAGKKIWLASWNCENMAPSGSELDNFLPPVLGATTGGKANYPDLIFIGLQEGNKGGSGNNEFVHTRLAKRKRMGANYEEVVSSEMAGRTKGTNNYQQLGMLKKNGVAITNIRTGNYTSQAPTGLTGGSAFTGGKGGVWITFNYEGKSIAVVSAHLDSFNAQTREREIKGVLANMCSLSTPYDTRPWNNIKQALKAFHQVFFMGDLNYRLFSNLHASALTFSVAPAPNTSGQLKVWDTNGVPQQCKIGSMCHTLLSAAGRAQLISHDQLLQSPLITQLNFSFPRPQCINSADICYPTYKRDYSSSGKTRVANFVRPDGSGRTLENVRKIYGFGSNLTSNVPLKVSRGNVFDMGWLDRIAWFAPTAPIGNRVVLEKFHDFEHLILSDHVPVLMKARFA